MFFFQHHGLNDKDYFRANKLVDASFPAHLHRAFELIFVHRGTLFLQVEQRQYKMEANDLAFIFCNQIHSFSSPAESEISVVLFSPELIGAFYSAHKNLVPDNNLLYLDLPPDFHNLHGVYAQKSMLYDLCDKLLASTGMLPSENQSQAELLQQIFAYVDQHHGGNCTLQAVSRALQYDYTYLSKLFARQVGIRFTEYLNNYRIALACYLLQLGGQPISDIAANCGYSTLRSFHRNFHDLMHCSPREYMARKA